MNSVPWRTLKALSRATTATPSGPADAAALAHVSIRALKVTNARLLRQYLYFCSSKASKVHTYVRLYSPRLHQLEQLQASVYRLR
jgi:hypothetical protein